VGIDQRLDKSLDIAAIVPTVAVHVAHGLHERDRELPADFALRNVRV